MITRHRELGERAKELLGYNWLSERVLLSEDEPVLMDALIRLEIDILTPESVEKYLLDTTQSSQKQFDELQTRVKRYESRLGGYDRPSDGTVRKRRKEFEAEYEALHHVEWAETPIREYQYGIPEEALLKALRVKEALEEAEFSVLHTTEATKPVLKFNDKLWKKPRRTERTVWAFDPDPFLKVTLGKQSAYIAVWEEAGYQYAAVQDQLIAKD